MGWIGLFEIFELCKLLIEMGWIALFEICELFKLLK
jgi:hypothetical protein